jgi:HEPN domain-containing protein
VNINDLRLISEVRLAEAKSLLKGRHYDGAYYLAGYVVECALKACIAKKTKRYDFPNKRIAIDSYTHDLNQLIRVAGLQATLEAEMRRDEDFAVNWAIVKDWNEESRYERHDAAAAKGLYSAVADTRHGVLRWLKRHW